MLHNYVAKILCLYKRSIPHIQMAVAFLTTKVKGLDKDYWKISGEC